VWLDPASHVFHLAGSKDYGKGKSGGYACKAEAERSGSKAAKG
jgi:hypothetical protein